jgi:hypothetical protein
MTRSAWMTRLPRRRPASDAERVTLRVPTHLAAPSHALILREGPKPTRPRGSIPRVARLLALAHHFQKLIDTRAVETSAELAKLAKLTTARVTQIMEPAGPGPGYPGGDPVPTARDRGAASDHRAAPAAGAEDGRVKGSNERGGGNLGSALASSLSSASSGAFPFSVRRSSDSP